MFVVHVHQHDHPIWLATRIIVLGVSAWVTRARWAQLVSKSVTLWYSLSETKVRDKNLSPLFFKALSFEVTYFEATYFEGTLPVYFEGFFRSLFSSLISSKPLKCSRGSDEVTVTTGIGHIKGTCM